MARKGCHLGKALKALKAAGSKFVKFATRRFKPLGPSVAFSSGGFPLEAFKKVSSL